MYHFRRNEDYIAWFARQLNDLSETHGVKNIVSANMPMRTLSKKQWECIVTRRDAIFVRNRSCRTTRDFVIIISPIDIAVQRIQIVNYKNSFYIPVVFHNLSSYDAYFIIKEIAIAYDGQMYYR